MISGCFQANQNNIAQRHFFRIVVSVHFRQMKIAIDGINLKSVFANVFIIASEKKVNFLSDFCQHSAIKSAQSACSDYSRI